MKRPDLVVYPQDWVLGLWWASWPTVTKHVGGDWFAYALRDEHSPAHAPSWQFWTHRRYEGGPWFVGMVVWQIAPSAVRERGRLWCRNEVDQRFFWHTGEVPVGGRGGELARRVETGEASLPRWLHVLIIEHRPSSERSAAG